MRWALILLLVSFSIHTEAQDNSEPPLGTPVDQEAAEHEAELKAREQSVGLPSYMEFGASPETPTSPALPVVRPELPEYMPPIDPNSTELEQIDAAIRARTITGADQAPHCYFGPITKQISQKRLSEIAKDLGETESAWRAVLAENDDPESPPVEIMIRSNSGPNCDQDIDRALLERREVLSRDAASGQ